MGDRAAEDPADPPVPSADAPFDVSVAPVAPVASATEGQGDEALDEPAPEDEDQAPMEGFETIGAGAVASGIAPGVPLAGAYMPPAAAQRPHAVSQPNYVPAPSLVLPPASTSGWNPPAPPPAAPAAAPVQAGRASLFADLPFDAPDSVTEWLVAIGSGVAALSFLLPWISGTTSYMTSWGLGSASRVPILAALVITAVLGILPNRVALWVRAGVLGLIAGSVYLGNIWPIVAGDFGDAAFGAVIGAAAAMVLIVGGILAVAPRKPTAEPD